jgi:chromosome segregation ATPase
LSESSEQDLMPRLNELDQKMNNLNNTANALEEIEQIKEDVSCELIDDLKNEQMRELVESREKTVPKDLENLKNEYKDVRGKLAELRDEIRKSKSSSQD